MTLNRVFSCAFGGLLVLALTHLRAQASERSMDGTFGRGEEERRILTRRVERANRLYESGKFREATQLYRTILVHAPEAFADPAWARERLPADPFTEEAILNVRDRLTPSAKKNVIDALLTRGDGFLSIGDEDAAVDEYEKVFLLDASHRAASQRMDRARAQAIARLSEEQEAVTAHGT